MTRTTVAEALHTLELNERRWQAVLDTAPDAIISIDEDGRITLFNQTAQAIFGYTAEEVIGSNVSILMPPPYRDEHDQYLANYRQTGVPQAIGRIREVEARRKNGEVFPIELAISEARVTGEAIYTAIIRDVSDRRRAQAELHHLQLLAGQRERMADVGAITAKVVHDLGNPLAGLSMQAQLVMRRASRGDTVPSESIRQPIEQILSTVRRLDALVKEFMEFARDQQLNLRAIKLPQLLQDIINLWQPVAAERDISMTLEAVESEDIRADETHLKRVLDNLIKNAIEAIDRGPGRIDLSVSATHETVRISVEDTGPGFPTSIEGFRLFETTKPNGTGLGLAVARQIVTAHGGEIGFASVAPHGTVFHIDLPRHGPASTFA
jgi:two-component system sensor kinase FixL